MAINRRLTHDTKILANLLQFRVAGGPMIFVAACVKYELPTFYKGNCHIGNAQLSQLLLAALGARHRKTDYRLVHRHSLSEARASSSAISVQAPAAAEKEQQND
jgi:hypothetical protein